MGGTMIKTILASLTGFGSDKTVLDAAFAVARRHNSHVTCLHTRIDPNEGAALVGVSATQIHGNLLELTLKINREQQERSGRAQSTFADASKSHNVPVRDNPERTEGASASLLEVTTFLDETLRRSRYHDLVVMGRVPELAAEQLDSMVMQSGRPLLIAPSKPTRQIGEKVMIAWKDGPEAARALSAALPILAHAKHVTIVTLSEHSSENAREKASAESVVEQLGWHGIQAKSQVSNSPVISASRKLEEIAFTLDADLLVMGAYGHSRLREFVFGGVTR